MLKYPTTDRTDTIEIIQTIISNHNQTLSSKASAQPATLLIPTLNENQLKLISIVVQNIDVEFVEMFTSYLYNTTDQSPGTTKTNSLHFSMLNETNINKALVDALIEYNKKYASLYEPENTDILILLSYRTRIRMVQLCQTLFKSNVERLFSSALDTFEVLSKKTPTDIKYPKRLRIRSSAILRTFKESCESMKKGQYYFIFFTHCIFFGVIVQFFWYTIFIYYLVNVHILF